jgi:DNA polymerase-1
MKNGGANNLIIDGNNLLYRIFWTNNFKLDEENSPGQVFLFLRSLKSYVDKFQPKEIYCTWDKKLEWPSTNFRSEATTVEYKANRDDDKFKNVHEYSEKIQEIIALLGVHNMYPLRMEADDLMAWLSTHLPGKSVIITTDKDLLQTISADTRIYSPIKKKEVTLQNFEEYTGVCKEQYLNYRAITGDKSDNIPGIPRYGLARFKKLDLTKLTDEQQIIYERNIKLMDLSIGYDYYPDEVPVYEEQLNNCKNNKSNYNKFIEEVKKLNMWSIVRNYSSWRESFNNNENIINIIKKAIKKCKTEN